MVNSVDDVVSSGLSFCLEPGASYIVDRRSVTWYASGAQTYVSGQGARVIRIALNGDGWIDPSTVRLNYTLNNTTTTAGVMLRPIGGPWSLFSRLRVQYRQHNAKCHKTRLS